MTNGLEGVVVADTRLSDVDGERGRLVLAGHDAEVLAGRVSFEAACSLLWNGELPDPDKERALCNALGEARVWAFEHLPLLGGALDAKDGMAALRAALAQLEGADPIGLVGATSVYAAAWARRRTGAAPLSPDPTRAHAADYLAMVGGLPPDHARKHALDTYLVTVIDHGLNASTFAARVVASTGSDVTSAVVAAIGALKGPLHGGAPGPVLDMLDAIGDATLAASWLEREIEAGRRVMGMGHRIYRVRDPRAAVLERAVEALEHANIGGAQRRLALARRVEHEAEALLAKRHPDRPLRANVEFYTAVLLEAVGLPRELFSSTFAVARVAGWLAHFAEQRATGRLIRPASRYVGTPPTITRR